jgi:hypothetical protein
MLQAISFDPGLMCNLIGWKLYQRLKMLAEPVCAHIELPILGFWAALRLEPVSPAPQGMIILSNNTLKEFFRFQSPTLYVIVDLYPPHQKFDLM